MEEPDTGRVSDPRDDDLCLCRVLAVVRDPLFERAAKRWLMMLASEGRQSLAEVQAGATALVALQVDPADEGAFQALEGLVQFRSAADSSIECRVERHDGCSTEEATWR
ncbi:MAG TPA: hypothetical protein VND98_07705 [Solirubrobacterales bacterium]|nr:hypothetical protein [Solirubrobacterales bacterium]